MSKDVYTPTEAYARAFLDDLMKRAVIVADGSGRKMIKPEDIIFALKSKEGRRLAM